MRSIVKIWLVLLSLELINSKKTKVGASLSLCFSVYVSVCIHRSQKKHSIRSGAKYTIIISKQNTPKVNKNIDPIRKPHTVQSRNKQKQESRLHNFGKILLIHDEGDYRRRRRLSHGQLPRPHQVPAHHTNYYGPHRAAGPSFRHQLRYSTHSGAHRRLYFRFRWLRILKHKITTY